MGEPAFQSPFQLHVVEEARAQAQAPRPPRRAMLRTEVSDYIRTAPERFLDCREGRHRYAKVKLSEMRFTRRGDGMDVWTTPCQDCGAAYREEVWLIKEGPGGIVRDMEFIGASTKYFRPGNDDEESYLLPPGNGYLSKHDLRETRVGDHFIGQKVSRVGRRNQGGT